MAPCTAHSTIDLCLAAFPWASFRRTKGAIKLHVGVDQAGHLPTFISVTDGKTGDVTVARTWTFPAGSVVVADRAYLDFGWLHQLQQRGVTFVTRLKRNVRYQVVREHDVDIRTGVLSDQTIELTSARSRKAYPGTLRRVGYWDEETRRSYVFVTNNTTWVGKTIANLYKSRWQIELFFQVDQAASEGEALRRPDEERGSVATVGGDVYVPAVGLPEVRPATELEPAPDATSSPAQPVRPPSTGGAVHDALATGFPRPSDAAVALKMWDSSDRGTCCSVHGHAPAGAHASSASARAARKQVAERTESGRPARPRSSVAHEVTEGAETIECDPVSLHGAAALVGGEADRRRDTRYREPDRAGGGQFTRRDPLLLFRRSWLRLLGRALLPDRTDAIPFLHIARRVRCLQVLPVVRPALGPRQNVVDVHLLPRLDPLAADAADAILFLAKLRQERRQCGLQLQGEILRQAVKYVVEVQIANPAHRYESNLMDRPHAAAEVTHTDRLGLLLSVIRR